MILSVIVTVIFILTCYSGWQWFDLHNVEPEESYMWKFLTITFGSINAAIAMTLGLFEIFRQVGQTIITIYNFIL